MVFSASGNIAFPRKDIETKSKWLTTPWITKGQKEKIQTLAASLRKIFKNENNRKKENILNIQTTTWEN